VFAHVHAPEVQFDVPLPLRADLRPAFQTRANKDVSERIKGTKSHNVGYPGSDIRGQTERSPAAPGFLPEYAVHGSCEERAFGRIGLMPPCCAFTYMPLAPEL
jgi:hypothetical protein